MVTVAEKLSIQRAVEAPSSNQAPRRTLEEAWEAFRERQDEQLLESSLRRFSIGESREKNPGEEEVDDNEPAPTGEELRTRREAIKGLSQLRLARIMPGGKRTTIAETERGVRANEVTRKKIGNVISIVEQLGFIPDSISF